VKVSVIMAVYNSSQFLKPAIESILNQTLQDFEFIIVNDGSIDNSLEIIKSYNDERIILIDQENTGVANARNNGIKIAKSDFIAIQDSDDISICYRLDEQFNFLASKEEYILVGGNAEIIDENENVIYYTDVQERIDSQIKLNRNNMPFVGPSIFFKKAPFLKVGGYPVYMENTFEDLILINRLKSKGKMANLKNNLIKYRITVFSLTQRDRKKEERLTKIIIKAIKYDKIENDDIRFLRNRLKRLPDNIRKSNYHLFLMKKYLFNNYNFKNAFINWSSAIFYNPVKFQNYIYLGIMILPDYLIHKIYKLFKSYQGVSN
jgi:glycosyltransferase involved in cell wall biosynthesis